MGHYYYELTVIIHPHQSENLTSVIQPYLELIQKDNGTVLASEDWGKRLLAYPMNKLQKGHYFFLFFSCTPNMTKIMKTALGYDKFILRHLIVRKHTPEYIPSELLGDDLEADTPHFNQH
jgi:small subunit ribosomal protein S6